MYGPPLALFSSVASCFISLESKYCTLKQPQATILLYNEIPNLRLIKRCKIIIIMMIIIIIINTNINTSNNMGS